MSGQTGVAKTVLRVLAEVVLAGFFTALFTLAVGLFITPLEKLAITTLLFVVLVALGISILIVLRISRGLAAYIEGHSHHVVKPPTFRFMITEKKDAYHRNEHIYFYSKYDGLLTDGYFVNVIHAPTGTHFRKGGSLLRIKSPQSYRIRLSTFPIKEGALNHDELHQERWSWRIPKDAPLGTYSIEMIVGNAPLLGQWGFKRIAQSDDAFVVS